MYDPAVLRPLSDVCAWVVIITLSVPLAGCGTPGPEGDSEGDSEDASEDASEPGEFESLIDQTLWVQIDAQADPLADHRPAELQCSAAGWYLELESLEVNTNYCNYLALHQPSLAPIQEGRGIRLGFYHFNLTAVGPGSAHIAMLVDGALLWEQDIEIPGTAAVYSLEFPAPLSAPAGADIVFHLHNHGQNTWVLQGLSAEQ